MAEANFWQCSRARRLGRRRLLMTAGEAGVASLAVAACSTANRRSQQAASQSGGASAGGAPRTGGTLYITTSINPVSLDPQKVKGNSAHLVASHVTNRLFEFSSATDAKVGVSQQIENNLAVGAESPDGVTWTIKLRPDAKFQNIPPVNGHAVEAEDVKATFQRGISLPGSLSAPYLTMMDKDQIQTPDSTTVVFKLKYPYGLLPEIFVNDSAGHILPREALAASYDPSKTAIGSGPFLLANYTPDVGISFKRNPDWYLRGRPYVDGVEIAIVPTIAQQLAQFTAGKLDEFWPDVDNVATTKQQNPKATAISVPNLDVYQVFGHLDTPNSPFKDSRVRQAISLAIDRDTIAKVLFNGQFQNNGVMSSVGRGALPPDQLGPASQYFKYDPAQAKRLVSESGAGDAFAALVYPAQNYGPQFDKLAQMINPMLNAVGFKTQLVALDYNRQWIGSGSGVFYGHYPDNNLVLQNWIGAAQSADYTLASALLPDGSTNHARINDPQLTQLVNQMQGIPDEKQRLQKVQEIQRYVADKMYYISGIPTGENYVFVQPWVQNYCYSYNAPQGSEGEETFSKLWLNR